MPRLCVAVISCVLRVSSGSAHTWVPWFNDTETGSCLEDAVPATDRKWSGPAGRNITTAISDGYWTHQEIASRIMVILIRERLGVHTNVIFPADAEYLIFYAGVAGCNDWEYWTCDDFTGEDPPLHFATPWYVSGQRQADDLLADVAASDPEAHSRVISMANLGYLVTGEIYVFTEVVDRAWNESGGTLSLDWHRDLSKEGVMEYFTPYNEIDISSGIYQSCAHNDANVLESRGYMCNPEYEYLNPWRRVGADGVWNESGASPPGFVPVYNCSELLENFPSAYEGWSALGYECRADGWWLAPPCAAKSPGDEWKDECIVAICYDPTYAPDVAPGVASLPAVAAAVSWFDVVDEYIYFWTSGHTTKNATPPTVLFTWWEPDASLNLWYGGHGQSYYYYYYYNSYYHDNYNLEGIDRRSQSYYPHEDIGGHNQSYHAYEDIGGHNQSYYAYEDISGHNQSYYYYEDIGGHNQSYYHNYDYNYYHYYYSRDVTEEVRPVNKTSIQFDARQQPIPSVPTTIAHETLYSLSPETASLLERFAIPSLDIHEMMTTVVEKFVEVGDRSLAKDEIACQWVRENRESWEGWTGASSCWADTYFDEDRGRCILCPDGTTSDRASSGIDSCKPCDPGFVYDASSGCVACDPGQYADTSTQRCALCPIATYSNESGMANCTPCVDGFSTVNIGSQSVDFCVCMAGTYLPKGSLTCASCPDGMTCDIGRDESTVDLLPQLKYGYWSKVSRPLEVYRCINARHCPGGPAETCATHRDSTSVACGICESNTFQDSGKECRACEGRGPVWILIVLCVLVAVVGLITVVFLVNKDVLQEQHATITCATVAGLTVTGLQTLGIFDSLSLSFTSPLREMVNGLTVLSFDIKILRVGCIVGHNVLNNFVGRQLLPIIGLLVVAVILAIKMRRTAGYLTALMNTSGTIFNVFFISIVISAIMPLVLYEHPGSTGWSVRSQPSVLVTSSEFALMLVVTSVAFVLLIIPFLTTIVYATFMYPRFVANPSKQRKMLAFRFLFFRYKPNCHYYGALAMTKSLSLCMVPVLVQDDPATQMMVISAIIQGSLVFQALTCPWKSRLTNIFDGTVSAGLQLVLICAAMSTDMVVDEELLSIMGMVSICFIFSAIVLASGISVYHRLLPSPRYDFFVCHHKVDASAQSRLLKCMMTARKFEVFIDSDDLQDLDTLFDTVRSRVRHLIVYLTKDTLTRPWCAGEIVTAHRNNVKTTVVLTDGPTGFTFLTDEELNSLDSYIEGGKALNKYLISMASVKMAYQWLLSDQVPLVRLPDAVRGRQRFENLVNLLLHGSAGVSDPHQPPQDDYVLVSTDPQDNEATAAASILCMVIDQELLGFMQNGTWMCVDQQDPDIGKLVEHARAVVVLLTACTMESLPQLTAIVSCMISKTVPVIPVTTPSFQFPGANFYDVVLPGIWTGDVDLARELIQNFFMTIAVSLAINSSMEVIEAQSKLVLRRVPQNINSFVRCVSGGASHGGASSADAPSDPQSRGPGFPADGESDGELSESNEESVDL